jgi:hypothetical protein
MGLGGWDGWQNREGSPSQITLNHTHIHSSHRDNRCALQLSLHYSLPIQGSLQLVYISKRKAEAGSSSLSPCFCNLASKRTCKGVSCFGSPYSNVRIWPFKYLLK